MSIQTTKESNGKYLYQTKSGTINYYIYSCYELPEWALNYSFKRMIDGKEYKHKNTSYYWYFN